MWCFSYFVHRICMNPLGNPDHLTDSYPVSCLSCCLAVFVAPFFTPNRRPNPHFDTTGTLPGYMHTRSRPGPFYFFKTVVVGVLPIQLCRFSHLTPVHLASHLRGCGRRMLARSQPRGGHPHQAHPYGPVCYLTTVSPSWKLSPRTDRPSINSTYFSDHEGPTSQRARQLEYSITRRSDHLRRKLNLQSWFLGPCLPRARPPRQDRPALSI